MYQALYRKYRPRCFSDVTGQEHITQTLREQMKNDRLSHAYLFVGTRGTGKTTCAKILSRVVNCEAPMDGDACNKCSSCIGIENGSILDVLELDAASNNGVDNIRAIREEAIYTPALVKKRIYIIDEVHMLTTSAFNALLKILEEPPEHLIFILATTELHKVPATIMSRCQRFMFRRLYPDAIAARLNEIADKEGISLSEEASIKLASLADGSMRDGISLFDQCATGATVDIERVLDTLGLVGTQEVISLVDAVGDRDITNAMSKLDELYKDGRDMASLLSEISAVMRDLLVFKLSPKSTLITAGRDQTDLSNLSGKYSSERLFFNMELIREALYSLSRGSAMRLTMEMCLIRMCDERLSDSITAILSRVTKLEEQQTTFGASPPPSLSPTDSFAQSTYEEPPPTITDDVPTPSLPIIAEDDKATHVAGDEETEAPLDTSTRVNDFWEDMLKELISEPPLYPIISNKDRVWAEKKNNTVIIYANDQFTVNQLQREMFLKPIKEAAQKALGGDTTVNIEFGSKCNNSENGTDKLDSLRAFGNVKFEQ